LLPWIWVLVVRALYRTVRRWSANSPGERFLLCQSLPLLIAFLGIACVRPLLPHWTLIGLLTAFPLLGRDWAELAAVAPARVRRRAIWSVGLLVLIAAVFLIQINTGVINRLSGGALRPAADPSADMYGWDQVASELERRHLLGEAGTFLFTGRWYHSGQLAFATRGQSPVLCYNPNVPHHFAYWSQPQDWVGNDGILVVVNQSSTEPAIYDRWFEVIEPAGEFTVKRGGQPVRLVRFFRCSRQTKPFEFEPNTARRRALAPTVAGEATPGDVRVR
jgi:hypothetical protein